MRRVLATIPVALLLSSCGTIMHGNTQGVGLSSSPTGAAVTIDNQPLGNTPTVATLSRKDHHVVRFTLPGYQPFEATLTRSVSGWVWGNLVFGGIPGLAVDAISGALYKLTPAQITGQLAQGTDPNTDCLYLFVTMSPDPSWQRVGSLARE